MTELQKEILLYGSEYTGTIKKLLTNKFDFGEKYDIAVKTASFNDKINECIHNSVCPEDKLFCACNNIFKLVHYTEDDEKRLELYFKNIGIVVPKPYYLYLYDEKFEQGNYEFVARFNDDHWYDAIRGEFREKAREEPMFFSDKLTFAEMQRIAEETWDGCYEEERGIHLEQRTHVVFTSYTYRGTIYTEKEYIK